MLRHTCDRQLEAGGIAWRGFYVLLHSAVERQLDESALTPPPLAPPLAQVVYSGARMKFSFIRLVATLLLSGQMLPVGLPLLCDQVQRRTSANCEQQMASHPHGLAVAATAHATPCANSAFCAITAPAVVAFGGTVSVSARESHIVGFGVSTLAPADPQAPLPPPPQA